jgi:REP element-mobilizing transposase RayT
VEREIKKYRIDSTRLKNWDYSSYGFYFITICTKNMRCYFGRIKNGSMAFSKAGQIVCEEWLKTSSIRKNIILDEWRLMPNHFHAILIWDVDEINAIEPKITNWNKNSLAQLSITLREHVQKE